MKVKIGGATILDAQTKRFIDLQSGLALSMIQVSYEGEPIKELGEAFQKHTLLPFECDTIKTLVLVHGARHDSKEKRNEYTFQGRTIDVPCGYKLVSFSKKVGNEKAIIVLENIKDTHPEEYDKPRQLLFIRFILEKDIPKDLFK
jgi:hypothetical protein